MDFDHREIDARWQKYWAEHKCFAAEENSGKPKYYGLTMFPYPSGAGLHVGHPLGYIASCICARYKRLNGFNVLHPMGYDSFGLPAEQYAIQTGQHPAITTERNIARYREQLDKLGFSFDWDREVKTSNPEYYKWTQWIFKLLYTSWFNHSTGRAESIDSIVLEFEKNGNSKVDAATDSAEQFSASEWKKLSVERKEEILMNYRLAFLADSWVNWCPALGTVLANDEIKDGVSERGGHPVQQKRMKQWMMRITAYSQRLLADLESLDWSESLKEMQRNWIGMSVGASVRFKVKDHPDEIEVFTTRPDTIFGVSFMTLAPEHPLVDKITSPACRLAVAEYKRRAGLRTERDRQSDTKTITGQPTGAFAIHPFSGKEIPIWIGDYVLAGYGTGAVMAVPCGDQRDWDFAQHFGLEIPNIFHDKDITKAAYSEKDGAISNSDFLDGKTISDAIKTAVSEIEKRGIGNGKINYRLRDAVFSRQRYWGEPFPVYYQNEMPVLLDDESLPLCLPEVDKFLPTETGEPPLGNSERWAWNIKTKQIVENKQIDKQKVYPLELNTMPGWAGSSWYFLRYMDPKNSDSFAERKKTDYWNQVDLYVGGSEHATGHLLYARFWNQFLFDLGLIGFREPFKKLINQGMILGRSSLVRHFTVRPKSQTGEIGGLPNNLYISQGLVDKIEGFENMSERNDYIKTVLKPKFLKVISEAEFNQNFDSIRNPLRDTRQRRVDVRFVENDELDIAQAKEDPLMRFLEAADFITDEEGKFTCGSEIEKMSKSKYNVHNPDELVEKYGADTVRCYEMFLGPLEQAKPWDTKGITGVRNFLRKFWRLFHADGETFALGDSLPDPQAGATGAQRRILNKAIKRVTEDLDRFSFNTVVSALMIAVNELTEQKCKAQEILEPLTILLSPYAPHLCEEMWSKMGHPQSITLAHWPKPDPKYLVESSFNYPVSFNGKTRFQIEFPMDMEAAEIEKNILASEQSQKYLEGKTPKKVIVVKGRIINVVV